MADQPHLLYRHFNSNNVLLYVGITRQDLADRSRDHRVERPWWSEVSSTTTEQYAGKELALEAECLAIARENPRYNQRRPHPSNIVRDASGEITSAGRTTVWMPNATQAGGSHHLFRGEDSDQWGVDWDEFKRAAKDDGSSASAVIRGYIRYHLRRGPRPKRPAEDPGERS